jgi:hypothetical protein
LILKKEKKKIQEEANPALEGRTFAMKQMKAYAKLSRLGFKVSFPAEVKSMGPLTSRIEE